MTSPTKQHHPLLWTPICRNTMCEKASTTTSRGSRSPSGERGLKLAGHVDRVVQPESRSPSGERGLKLRGLHARHAHEPSLLIRGAWIEIKSNSTNRAKPPWSLPIWGVWIEIPQPRYESARPSGRSPSGERGFLCRINTLVDVGIVPSILDIRICDGGNDTSLVPLVNV